MLQSEGENVRLIFSEKYNYIYVNKLKNRGMFEFCQLSLWRQ